jgi:NAD(P) transhydrogenase
MKQYDLFVIGTGPAGHHGAIQAAKLGKNKKVAVAEKNSCLGGACINTGTIPSKTLREAIVHLSGFKQRGMLGAAFDGRNKISIEDLTQRVEDVIRTEGGVFNSQFRRNGADILTGQASFADPHTLRVRAPTPM